MIYAIKNYYQYEACVLQSQSIKYFDPDAQIYLFNFVKNNEELKEPETIHPFDCIVYRKAKYQEGPGYNNPANGLYFSEGINEITRFFSGGKVIISDEHMFYTNGNTIKELKENNWDLAWAHWKSPEPNDRDMSASVIGIDIDKCRKYVCGWLPERKEWIESLLRKELLEPCINDKLNIYKMVNRDYNSQGADYKGDGFWCNDWESMEKELKNKGII